MTEVYAAFELLSGRCKQLLRFWSGRYIQLVELLMTSRGVCNF